MSDVDEHGRPEPPMSASEAETLVGFLEYQRATLRWKCEGLDAEALQRTVAPSSMTLGGLLKHLAVVEDYWFNYVLNQYEQASPWKDGAWDDDRDWDWHSAAEDDPEVLWSRWTHEVERSRAGLSTALERGGLAQLALRRWPDGTAPSLRWILAHMVEEYARHNGHADILREAIDGAVGE